jgi:hypothetical protein
VAGVVILLTGWYPIDPILSIGIAGLIAVGAWRILRETTDILLEAVPKDIHLSELVRDMMRVPGVADVHDLHVWCITSGMYALSCHASIADLPLSESAPILQSLEVMLREKYSIGHTTIQFECHAHEEDYCSVDGLYCSMDTGKPSHEAHDHSHASEEEQHTYLKGDAHGAVAHTDQRTNDSSRTGTFLGPGLNLQRLSRLRKSPSRSAEDVTMPSEMPSPNREHDAQMLSSVDSEPGDKPESIAVLTLKDHLIVALVSLVIFIFLAGLTFGATRVLHAGLIGWFAILAVIGLAVITINVVVLLCNPHLQRFATRPVRSPRT